MEAIYNYQNLFWKKTPSELVAKYSEGSQSGLVVFVNEIQTVPELEDLKGVNIEGLSSLINSPLKVSGMLEEPLSEFIGWDIPYTRQTWDDFIEEHGLAASRLAAIDDLLDLIDRGELNPEDYIDRYGHVAMYFLIRDSRSKGVAGIISEQSAHKKINSLVKSSNNLARVSLKEDVFFALHEVLQQAHQRGELISKYSGLSKLSQLVEDVENTLQINQIPYSNIHLSQLTALINSPQKIANILQEPIDEFENWKMPSVDLSLKAFRAIQGYLDAKSSRYLVDRYGHKDGSGVVRLIGDIQAESELSDLIGVHLSGLTGILSSSAKISDLLSRSKDDFKDWHMPKVGLSWQQYTTIQTYFGKKSSQDLVERYGQSDGSGLVTLLGEIQAIKSLEPLRNVNLGNFTALINSPNKISGLLGRPIGDFSDWNMPYISLTWKQFKVMQDYFDGKSTKDLVERYGQSDGSGVVAFMNDIQSETSLSPLRGIHLGQLTGLLNSSAKMSGVLNRPESDFKDWHMPKIDLSWQQYTTIQAYFSKKSSQDLVERYGRKDGSGITFLMNDIQTIKELQPLKGIHIGHLTSLLNSSNKISGLLNMPINDFKDWHMPKVSLSWQQFIAIQTYFSKIASQDLVERYGDADGSGIVAIVREIQVAPELEVLNAVNLGDLTGLLNSPIKMSGLLGRPTSDFNNWRMPKLNLTWQQYSTLQTYLEKKPSHELMNRYGAEDGSGIVVLVGDIQSMPELASLRGVNLGYLTGLLNSSLKISGMLGRPQEEFEAWNMPEINLTWQQYESIQIYFRKIASQDLVAKYGNEDSSGIFALVQDIKTAAELEVFKTVNMGGLTGLLNSPRKIAGLLDRPLNDFKNWNMPKVDLSWQQLEAIQTHFSQMSSQDLVERYGQEDGSGVTTLIKEIQSVKILDPLKGGHLAHITGFLNSPKRMAGMLNRPLSDFKDWNMPKVNLSWKQYEDIQKYFNSKSSQDLVNQYGQEDKSGLIALIREVQVNPELESLRGSNLGQLTGLINSPIKMSGMLSRSVQDFENWKMSKVELSWSQFMEEYGLAASRLTGTDDLLALIDRGELNPEDYIDQYGHVAIYFLIKDAYAKGVVSKISATLAPKEINQKIVGSQRTIERGTLVPEVFFALHEILEEAYQKGELISKYSGISGIKPLVEDVTNRLTTQGIELPASGINVGQLSRLIYSREKMANILQEDDLDKLSEWDMPSISLKWNHFITIQDYFKSKTPQYLVNRYGKDDGSGIATLISDIKNDSQLESLRGISISKLTNFLNSAKKVSEITGFSEEDLAGWNMPFIDFTWDQYEVIQEYFKSMSPQELVDRYGQEDGSGVLVLINDIRTNPDLKKLRGKGVARITSFLNSARKVSGMHGAPETEFAAWNMPVVNFTWDQYVAIQDYFQSIHPYDLVRWFGKADGSGMHLLMKQINDIPELKPLRGMHLKNFTSLLNSPKKISGLVGRPVEEFEDWEMPHCSLSWDQYNAIRAYFLSKNPQELVDRYGQEDGSGIVNLINDIEGEDELKSLRGIHLGVITSFFNSPDRIAGLLGMPIQDFKDWAMPSAALTWDQFKVLQKHFQSKNPQELVELYGQQDGSGVVALIKEIEDKPSLKVLRGINLGRLTSLLNSPKKISGILGISEENLKGWAMPHVNIAWNQYKAIQNHFKSIVEATSVQEFIDKYGNADGSGVVTLIKDINNDSRLTPLKGIHLGGLTSLLRSRKKLSGMLDIPVEELKGWKMPFVHLAWDQFKAIQDYFSSLDSEYIVQTYGQEGSGIVALIKEIESNPNLRILRQIHLAQLTGLLNSAQKLSGLLDRDVNEFESWNMTQINLTWDNFKTILKYFKSIESHELVAKYGQEDGSGVIALVQEIETNQNLQSLVGMNLGNLTGFLASSIRVAGMLGRPKSDFANWQMPTIGIAWDQLKAIRKFFGPMSPEEIMNRYSQSDGSGITTLINDIETEQDLQPLIGIHLGYLTLLFDSPEKISGLLNKPVEEFEGWEMPYSHFSWDQFKAIQKHFGEIVESASPQDLVNRYGNADGSGVLTFMSDVESEPELRFMTGLNLAHLTYYFNTPKRVAGILGMSEEDFEGWAMPGVNFAWEQFKAIRSHFQSVVESSSTQEFVDRYGNANGSGIVALVNDIEANPSLRPLLYLNIGSLTRLFSTPKKVSGIIDQPEEDLVGWEIPNVELTWNQFKALHSYINSMDSKDFVDRYGNADGSGIVTLVNDIESNQSLSPLIGVNLGRLIKILRSREMLEGMFGKPVNELEDWNMPSVNLSWDQFKLLKDYLGSMDSKDIVERYGQEDGSGVVVLIEDIEANPGLEKLRGINLSQLTGLLNSPEKISGVLGKPVDQFDKWKMPQIGVAWDQFKALQAHFNSMSPEELVERYGAEDESGLAALVLNIQLMDELKSLRGINLAQLTGFLNSRLKVSGTFGKDFDRLKDWGLPYVRLAWDQFVAKHGLAASRFSDTDELQSTRRLDAEESRTPMSSDGARFTARVSTEDMARAERVAKLASLLKNDSQLLEVFSYLVDEDNFGIEAFERAAHEGDESPYTGFQSLKSAIRIIAENWDKDKYQKLAGKELQESNSVSIGIKAMRETFSTMPMLFSKFYSEYVTNPLVPLTMNSLNNRGLVTQAEQRVAFLSGEPTTFGNNLVAAATSGFEELVESASREDIVRAFQARNGGLYSLVRDMNSYREEYIQIRDLLTNDYFNQVLGTDPRALYKLILSYRRSKDKIDKFINLVGLDFFKKTFAEKPIRLAILLEAIDDDHDNVFSDLLDITGISGEDLRSMVRLKSKSLANAINYIMKTRRVFFEQYQMMLDLSDEPIDDYFQQDPFEVAYAITEPTIKSGINVDQVLALKELSLSEQYRESNLRVYIILKEVSSVRAVEGFLRASGLGKDRVVLAYQDELVKETIQKTPFLDGVETRLYKKDSSMDRDLEESLISFPSNMRGNEIPMKFADSTKSGANKLVDGVLKYAYTPFKEFISTSAIEVDSVALRSTMKISQTRKIVVTSNGTNFVDQQEDRLIEVIQRFKSDARESGIQTPLFMLGVRNPEKSFFEKKLKQAGIRVRVRNDKDKTSDGFNGMADNAIIDDDVEVVLIHTQGELYPQLMGMADVVFLGENRNPGEPLALRKKMIAQAGDWSDNQELYDLVEDKGAIRIIRNADELYEAIKSSLYEDGTSTQEGLEQVVAEMDDRIFPTAKFYTEHLFFALAAIRGERRSKGSRTAFDSEPDLLDDMAVKTTADGSRFSYPPTEEVAAKIKKMMLSVLGSENLTIQSLTNGLGQKFVQDGLNRLANSTRLRFTRNVAFTLLRSSGHNQIDSYKPKPLSEIEGEVGVVAINHSSPFDLELVWEEKGGELFLNGWGYSAGGGQTNVAKVYRNFGLPFAILALVGRQGDLITQMYEKALSQGNLSAIFSNLSNSHRVNIKNIVYAENGELIEFPIIGGANPEISNEVLENMTLKITKLLEEVSGQGKKKVWLHFTAGGGIRYEEGYYPYERLGEMIRPKKGSTGVDLEPVVELVIDLNTSSTRDEIKSVFNIQRRPEGQDILTPNIGEFVKILDVLGIDHRDIDPDNLTEDDVDYVVGLAVDLVRGYSLNGIMITMDNQGVAFIARDQHEGEAVIKIVKEERIPVIVKNSVGAGDATKTGLVMALSEGLSPEEALHRANMFGAATVSLAGSSVADPTTIVGVENIASEAGIKPKVTIVPWKIDGSRLSIINRAIYSERLSIAQDHFDKKRFKQAHEVASSTIDMMDRSGSERSYPSIRLGLISVRDASKKVLNGDVEEKNLPPINPVVRVREPDPQIKWQDAGGHGGSTDINVAVAKRILINLKKSTNPILMLGQLRQLLATIRAADAFSTSPREDAKTGKRVFLFDTIRSTIPSMLERLESLIEGESEDFGHQQEDVGKLISDLRAAKTIEGGLQKLSEILSIYPEFKPSRERREIENKPEAQGSRLDDELLTTGLRFPIPLNNENITESSWTTLRGIAPRLSINRFSFLLQTMDGSRAAVVNRRGTEFFIEGFSSQSMQNQRTTTTMVDGARYAIQRQRLEDNIKSSMFLFSSTIANTLTRNKSDQYLIGIDTEGAGEHYVTSMQILADKMHAAYPNMHLVVGGEGLIDSEFSRAMYESVKEENILIISSSQDLNIRKTSDQSTLLHLQELPSDQESLDALGILTLGITAAFTQKRGVLQRLISSVASGRAIIRKGFISILPKFVPVTIDDQTRLINLLKSSTLTSA